MKGLLLLDLYLLKKNLLLLIVTLLIVGCSAVFLTTIDISFIILIFPVLMNTFISNSIIKDKSTKWDKYCACLPFHRSTYGKSKYIMYLIVMFFSIIISTVIVMLGYFIRDGISLQNIYIYISLGLSISLCSGAILVPGCIILEDEKLVLLQMSTYFLTALCFIGVTKGLNLLFDVNRYQTVVLFAYILASSVIFIVSWSIYNKVLCFKKYY